MNDAQYDEIADWLDGIAFRVFTYVAVMMFDLVLIVYGSVLYENGILTEGQMTLEFGLAVIGICATYLLLADFARGLRHVFILITGRHRGYIALGLVVAILAGLGSTLQNPDFGRYTDTYLVAIWSFSLVIGVELAQAGVFDDDFDQLRRAISS